MLIRMKGILISMIVSIVFSFPSLACEKDETYQAALSAWVKFKLEEALTLCNEVISRNPDCPNAYSLRGSIYSEKEQYAVALDDFNKSLTLDPEYEPSLSGRALVYYYLARYRKSINDYTHALYLKNDPLLFYGRGRAHRGNGENLKAWIDFSIAHFLEPENPRYVDSRHAVESAALREDRRNRREPSYESKIKRHHAYKSYESGDTIQAIELWEEILTNGGLINDVNYTLDEICRLYSQHDVLNRAEPFFITAIVYTEKFLPERRSELARLFKQYAEYLTEIGRDTDATKIRKNLHFDDR